MLSSLCQCCHKQDRHFSPYSSLRVMTTQGIAVLFKKFFEFQVYKDAGGKFTSISFAAMVNDLLLTKRLKGPIKAVLGNKIAPNRVKTT